MAQATASKRKKPVARYHTQRMKVAVWGLRALHSPRKDAGVAARSLHSTNTERGIQATCLLAVLTHIPRLRLYMVIFRLGGVHDMLLLMGLANLAARTRS